MLLLLLSLSSYLQVGLYKVVIVAQVVINHVIVIIKQVWREKLTILSYSRRIVIVGSLSESRLKSVRFLVEEISEAVTSYEAVKIIKINH
jgi:hypothetical protein